MSHKDKVMKLVDQRGEIKSAYVLLYNGQQVVSFDYEANVLCHLDEEDGLLCEDLDVVSWPLVRVFKQVAL